MEQQLTDKQEISKFIRAGNAKFTLMNDEHHYTYTVKKKINADDSVIYFVSLGISYEDSIYMGLLVFGHGESMCLKLTRNSRVSNRAPAYIMFQQFLSNLVMPYDLAIDFYHVGRCCVCARELTNPESIARGIGPECAGKI